MASRSNTAALATRPLLTPVNSRRDSKKKASAEKKRRRAVDSLSAVDAARRLEFEDSSTGPSLFVAGSEKSAGNEKVGSLSLTPETSPRGRRLKGDRAGRSERSERRVSPDLPFNLVTGDPAGTSPSQGLPTVAPTNFLSLFLRQCRLLG